MLFTSVNVVAIQKGTKYPNRYVIMSGDIDSRASDTMDFTTDAPGANDNASGTSALLEMAQAFQIAKDNGHGPKRSILFFHSTAEEIGLQGSRYYSENPLLPLENKQTINCKSTIFNCMY